MSFGDLLKKLFSSASATPADAPRLPATSESALESSLQGLPTVEVGWITLAEAAQLFSTEESRYAFGEMDEAGKLRLGEFSAEDRCTLDYMTNEGGGYFAR